MGLNKAALLKNKRGKVVSKKQNAAGKRAYKHIQSWTNAVKAARKELKVRGFVAVNGKTQQGKAIYVKAKAILAPEVRALLKTELAGAVAPFVVLPRGIPRSGLRPESDLLYSTVSRKK